MDPRLIHHYNEELQRLRGESVEFAEEYRSAAGMLKLQDGMVADPYVERLLEGVAYLSARVRLKLDSQFPDFTQQLLEVLFPGWQAPMPSACIVQMKPLDGDPRLHQGHTVPRKTLVVGALPDMRTEFETTSAVELWPLQVASLHYRSLPDEFTRGAPSDLQDTKALLRLELELRSEEIGWAQLPLDRLRFYVACEEPQASLLMELLLGRCLAVSVSSDPEGKRHTQWLQADQLRHAGLDEADALMPMPVRGHVAFRLLREYAALREKFNFVELSGLKGALRPLPGRRCFLRFLLAADHPRLEKSLKAESLKLYCTPAVNLRQRSLERLDIVPGQMDYPVVVDKHRVRDHEIVQVLDVAGGGQGVEKRFAPLYEVAANGRLATDSFYALRRHRRLVTEKEAEQQRRWARSADGFSSGSGDNPGQRPADSGNDVFIALTQKQSGPPSPALQYLSIKALCMDRDGPRWLRAHPAEARYELQDSLPADKHLSCLVRPSEALQPRLDGFDPWVALSLLSTNYLSLVDGGDRPAVQAFKALLGLFHERDDHYLKAQADALVSISAETLVRRLPPPDPQDAVRPDALPDALPAGRGAQARQSLLLAQGFRVKISLAAERGFEGGSPFVLGSLLAAYLRAHVGINSFVETELHKPGWPQPLRWAARLGHRPSI